MHKTNKAPPALKSLTQSEPPINLGYTVDPNLAFK